MNSLTCGDSKICTAITRLKSDSGSPRSSEATSSRPLCSTVALLKNAGRNDRISDKRSARKAGSKLLLISLKTARLRSMLLQELSAPDRLLAREFRPI